ncbi:RHS repeat-associated core domain-containing protein [Pseudomonas putida]|uniref:RHS repeat-associated core domain-containing protein n=1 Tax=Pseudomonas putida TaxID=303 RepID=UPI002739536D|nr:RHS repeat-associated core domain-containing protein [Pseudomonas putida]WLP04287.1 RHS repeat-associated core domain-containing protein [Pseudomonas putida]
MNLINTDWVTSIVLPTHELASWRLEYALVNGLLCVSKVEPPTGAREYLYYQDRGHLFPGDARPPLPRVTRHVIEPRGGQPAFQRTYTYPGLNNFLGYGAGIGWSDNGLDNLYESKRYDYEYQTVETLRDEDGTALRDITRTFNRFHLLTSTRTVQNNCVHEVTMQYNIKDVPFNQQVSTLQMPIREQTRWSLADNITRSRLETVETTYDTSGNIIWRKLANGVTETQEWYGTQAEDDYPGDANGFVRHLKSKTTTPASSGRGQAPVLTQHYRYKALAPLAGNAITLNPMIVEHSETLTHAHDPAHPLEEKIYYYLDAPKSSLRHGRRYQEVVKRNKLETTTQYQFNSLLDPLGGHQVLETRKTLFGYDGAQRSTVQRRSLLHGEKLYELNENGVHTQWAYDALRRVTEERVSPETPFGAQYFDGLDRLIGTTTGDRTEYFLFRDGESIPRQRINPAGETIEQDYNLQLTNEPISNTAPEEHASFAYDPVSARLLSDDNRQCARRFEYNKANQLTAEHWEDKRDGKTWSRIHSSTLQDRLKNTHEPYGEDTTHEYDAQGRLVSTLQGQLQAEFKYDDLGRIELITSHDRASAQALETKIEYDDQDREVKRTWRQPGQPERTQETVWDKDDLLLSRTLQVGGVSRLVEKFGYDSHARLNMYNCTGPDQPRDALGRSIAMQVFNFDAYNNIELTVTSFTGGPAAERATFIHAERDPCQLQRIEYTPPRTAPNPEFSYDANGNLTRDEQARPIRYDSQNRLLGLNDSGAPDTYGYDAGGLLVSRPEAGERTLLLHDGQRLRMAVRDSLQTLYLHHDEQALGQQQKGTGAQSPLLLHTSASHSVIAESQAGSTRAVRYTAYGERHADDPLLGTLGYNGEALDPDSGWYLLGSGYRAYNPVLMRFHSPDALSPFGAGGLNYYGYCQGNPITFRDPTGHYSIGYSGQSRSLADLNSYSIWRGKALGAIGWTGIGLGILFAAVASVAAVVVTGGVAAPAIAAAWAAAGGGISGAGAALSAGVGAIASVSLAVGIKLAAAVATATLSVTGTALQTEAILSGHEKRNNIGTILNYSAAILGLAVGAMQLIAKIPNLAWRAGSYTRVSEILCSGIT